MLFIFMVLHHDWLNRVLIQHWKKSKVVEDVLETTFKLLEVSTSLCELSLELCCDTVLTISTLTVSVFVTSSVIYISLCSSVAK